MNRFNEIAGTSLATRRAMVKAGIAATGAGVAGLGIARFGAGIWAQDDQGTPPAGGPGDQGGGPGESSDTLDAFVGVTTDGTLIEDLYPIAATGVSTDAVRTAAIAFLDSLTDEQKAATLFTVDDDEWRKWSNIDGYSRQGTSLREMTDEQKTAAMALLETSLSGAGYEKTENIMKLNHTPTSTETAMSESTSGGYGAVDRQLGAIFLGICSPVKEELAELFFDQNAMEPSSAVAVARIFIQP